ncbi:MAG: hypothetical protein A2W22_04100 [Candidatus Levybacteria bacterium RBG_16_35_11]|nr:MAG: hypothetical protein A2W22_04100 [Candidatus Levybacteria bacterium RBG_16_35_11]
MITVIHGDDLPSSRTFYLDRKNKCKEPNEFSGEKITITDLLQLSYGGSLFSLEKTVFIENLLSNKKSSSAKEVIGYIKDNHKGFNFFLWESGELSKATLSQLPGVVSNLFKIPQNLFLFLDNIIPNSKKNIIYFHKALDGTNQELILFMLIRQFRLMLAILSKSTIDEIKRLAFWQKDKIKKQARLFGEEALIKSIKRLHRIDYEQKSGQTGLNLVQTIDIFLLSI